MLKLPYNAADPLHAALRSINDSRGRGTIYVIDSEYYHVRLQFGTAKYRYHVDGGTVRSRGTSCRYAQESDDD